MGTGMVGVVVVVVVVVRNLSALTHSRFLLAGAADNTS